MPNSDMARIIQKLSNIDNSLGALVKVLEASNNNFVQFAKDFNGQAVDLDKLSEDAQKLQEIKKRTDEADYSAHQLEKVVQDANDLEIPAVVEPSDSYSIHLDAKEVLNRFVPDETGRLYPSEWRHNLGINTIRVMKPDTGMAKLSANENRRMTRRQFDMYNTELLATGVIMNEEDAEGTPDERGRLKPYEWRHKLGLQQFDPAETGYQFDENRLMTEEDFVKYNGRLYAMGTIDAKWRGDF